MIPERDQEEESEPGDHGGNPGRGSVAHVVDSTGRQDRGRVGEPCRIIAAMMKRNERIVRYMSAPNANVEHGRADRPELLALQDVDAVREGEQQGGETATENSRRPPARSI